MLKLLLNWQESSKDFFFLRLCGLAFPSIFRHLFRGILIRKPVLFDLCLTPTHRYKIKWSPAYVHTMECTAAKQGKKQFETINQGFELGLSIWLEEFWETLQTLTITWNGKVMRQIRNLMKHIPVHKQTWDDPIVHYSSKNCI